MNTCEKCGRNFEYVRSKGGTKKVCNTCTVNFRRFKLRDKIFEMVSPVCQHCGYDTYREALCFHHVDPSTKSFNISGSHCRSWQSIVEEVKKCILLCQNCHTAFHSNALSLDEEKLLKELNVNLTF